MEVQGTVFVCDIDEDSEGKIKIQGGFSALDQPIEPHERDDIPRILIRNFRRNTKPFKLYLVFHKFGTVTYLAVKDQLAVIEFTKRAPITEILKCKFLKVEGSSVNVECLQRFLHCETNQFIVEIHEDLDKLSSTVDFDNYIVKINELSNAQSKPETERLICKKLEDITRRIFRDCKAYTFGSRVTHLGLFGCDLDIFYDCGNMYNGEFDQEQKDQQAIGEGILREMVRSNEFKIVNKVWHARVPILKFYHIPTATYGDIAFRSGLGIENSKLLIFLQSVDKRVHFLFLFVKNWACLQRLRRPTEKCLFSSYSLIMMTIFYMQQLKEPILPPIQKLMDLHCGEKTIISGWPCSFTQDKKTLPKTKNNSTMLELTKGFFKFYQYYHFEWKIICPLLGNSIEKKDMEEILDPESDIASLFPTYIRQLDVNGDTFKTKCVICVQDPFELSHNLTRGIKEEVLMRFISSCGLIYEKLNSLD